MKKFVILSAALVLIGAGCGSPATSSAPEPAAVAPATAPAPAAKAEPADIRVTAIDAAGNAAGTVTEQGCDGPKVDLKITLQNRGADYPDPEGFKKLKAMIDARQGDFGAVPFEESEMFGVRGEIDFDGKIEDFYAPVRPRDLPDGKLKNGQSFTVKTSVSPPCCDKLPATMKLMAHLTQASSFIAPGEAGIKEPYRTDAELKLPDVTPGHGQFVRLGDGRMGAKVSVDNIGNAPTAGPVKVQVSLARKGSGFSSADWEMRIEEPFTGSASVIAPEASTVTGEPDYSKVTIGVYPLCPSKAYDIISDANPQNDHVEREATAP